MVFTQKNLLIFVLLGYEISYGQNDNKEMQVIH